MKKIVIVLHDLHCGGVEKSLVSFLKELDYTKVDVDVYLFRKMGDFLDDIPKTVNIFEYPLDTYSEYRCFSPGVNGIKLFFRNREFGKAIYCLLLLFVEIFFYRNKRWKFVYWHFRRKSPVIDKEYDIAIDYQGLGSAILPMAVVLDKTKVQKRYSWIHSDISAIPKSMLELAFLLAHFDKIVCVSKAAQNELLKLYPKFQTKVCVLYNIIPKNEIISLSQCCIDYTPKTGQTSILTVGRLEKTKGYDVALNSLYLLKQNDIDFRYIIVGDGSQRTELEKLSKKLSLENNVFFVGKTTNPYPYYRIADIYLQPSRFEGYCITLAEARLFHLPIVTTDFAGAREQIIPNCTGVIVACDSREIAEQLMILCKDKNKCDRFSKELIENEKNVSYSEKINDLLQVDDGV